MKTIESSPAETHAAVPCPGAGATRVCAVMLVLYALYYARSMAVPVVTAFVIYMVFRPLVRQGKRWGIHPAVGAASIMVGLLVAFGLAI